MFIRNFDKSFYGDDLRWWYGVVEDNNDPMKLGRCRVRIYGVHSQDKENISTGDLPWATIGLPVTEAANSGIGRTGNLLPGTSCFGIFLDGKSSQLPFILASIPKIEGGLTENKNNGVGVTGSNSQYKSSIDNIIDDIKGSNVEKAFNYFIAYGFTPEQSAGVVGNLMVESGVELNTTIKSGGSENSYGIAQWNSAAAAGNRFGLLQEFAKDVGQSWKELNTQLQFIIYELENFSYLGYGQLRSAKTIEEAAIIFETKYEKPSQAHRSRRIAYAKEIYNRFSG